MEVNGLDYWWKRAKEAEAMLEEICGEYNCHKGCGLTRLENHCESLICANCGEELEDRMTPAFAKMAKEILKAQ